VLQLSAGLAARASARSTPLSHDDFHQVTAELNKQKLHAVYGKPQVIHEYRACVRDGLVPYSPQVEGLLIKKLGKSGYGGVNLSLFIPPGHSAPLWNVTVTRAGATLTVDVVDQKSVYTLLGYRNYTRHSEDRPVLVAPGLRARTLEDKRLVAELTDASTALGLFEISLEHEGTGSRGDIERLAEGVAHPGTLKGSEALKTCTFGCVYCPTEVDEEGEQVNPKSYLTHESGVLRAVRNRYSTAEQVYDRLDSLQSMGHNTSKVFVRIVGGTWSVLTSNAQETFVRDTLFALNTMDAPLDTRRSPLSLEEEQTLNETASCRAVEICVEDHPKMVTPASLTNNRRLGVTAMEIGVQTTNDEVHRVTKRDSSRAQIVDRTKLMKEFGFKVLAHL
jgi:hypothetical protein